MPEVSFTNLVVVAAIAVGAPMLVGIFPRIRVPAVVLEIIAGIVVGPSGLGWVEIDEPIEILALMGLAFLLFLAGLEIDATRLRGHLLRLAGFGFLLTVVLGVGTGAALDAGGFVESPLLVGIALMATSLGLVVPVLKDAGQAETPLGQLVIASSSVADFGAVVLLTLFFSGEDSGAGAKLVLLGGFGLLVVAAALGLSRLGRSMRLEGVLVRLQDTTAEIRIRIAVLILIAFVALAEQLGIETILGAFLAGAILNMVDRDAMSTHPHFRIKLEAIGYGFLIPVFFVTSGLRFDLQALVDSPSAIARVPLFLLALLVVRALPAALYRSTIEGRGAVAAGLLQATSLPFLVTAAAIGLELGELTPETGAALVSAGLLSVIVFPIVSLALLRTGMPAADEPVAAPRAPTLTPTEAAAPLVSQRHSGGRSDG
ncbi:MAG TPA: cation:proton antiporter [Acidimicrobiales bacterium]|nr:cation:proton antiporter [Acidimicrobiales bacterium]